MKWKTAFKVIATLPVIFVGVVGYLVASDDTEYNCELRDGVNYCSAVVTEQAELDRKHEACKDQRMKDYTFGKYNFTQSLKDPSSFKQIGYPRKFADSYEITYSATNSYGGRVQETYSIPVTNCKYK